MSSFETNKGECPKDKEEAEKIILNSFKEAGLENTVPQEILDRLILLERETKFNLHARNIARGLCALLKHLNKKDLLQAAKRAALVHDIGKTGPKDATSEERSAFVLLFQLNYAIGRDPNNTTVAQAVTMNGLSGKKEEIASVMEKYGISMDMLMRDFYDQHALWTKEILEAYPEIFDKDTLIIAVSHHLERGVNPYDISTLKVELSALLALDKYEASVTRKSKTHKEAMEVVRNLLISFKNDVVLQDVLNALDELGEKGELFL